MTYTLYTFNDRTIRGLPIVALVSQTCVVLHGSTVSLQICYTNSSMLILEK